MENIKRKIILYDQDCGFCVQCKNFAGKRNVINNLYFVDIRSDEAQKYFSRYRLEKDFSTVWFFDERIYFDKSYAVLEIFKYMKWPWKFIYYFKKILPKRFMDFVYDAVSENRNRFQRNRACKIGGKDNS